jgi:hypothetical protein
MERDIVDGSYVSHVAQEEAFLDGKELGEIFNFENILAHRAPMG